MKASKIKGVPLNFDEDLKWSDHKGCNEADSYPDLSMSLVQRNQVMEERKR